MNNPQKVCTVTNPEPNFFFGREEWIFKSLNIYDLFFLLTSKNWVKCHFYFFLGGRGGKILLLWIGHWVCELILEPKNASTHKSTKKWSINTYSAHIKWHIWSRQCGFGHNRVKVARLSQRGSRVIRKRCHKGCRLYFSNFYVNAREKVWVAQFLFSVNRI